MLNRIFTGRRSAPKFWTREHEKVYEELTEDANRRAAIQTVIISASILVASIIINMALREKKS